MPPQTLTSSSLLATLTNKMQSRDNPLNRSTRPLLERRAQPQVMLSATSSSASSQNSSPSVIKSLKNFNTADVNKTGNKKLLLTGGFNDFHAIPKQFDALNSIHFQFPYGSPPSPVRDADFKFSDENQMPGGHQYNNQHHQSSYNPMKNPTIVTNRKLIAGNNHSYNNKKQPRKYNSFDNNDQQQQPHNGNGRNCANHYNNHSHQSSHGGINNGITTNALDCNDFSWRPVPPPRNFTNTITPPPQQRFANNRSDFSDDDEVLDNGRRNVDGGPFVFGIHNQMYDANQKNNVICARNKYSLSNNDDGVHQQQYNNKQSPNSSQNTSSSSTKTTEDKRQCLVKEKKVKKSKRAKKDKNDNSKRNSKASAIKCVLIGDGAVGKTNLIVSYIQDRFIPEYQPTVFDKFNVEVKIDDNPCWLTLCDTAGQDALDPLRQLCYPGSHVYLLCFSVIKPETFRSMEEKWIPEVEKLGGTLLLVGTQSDLRTDPATMARLQARSEKPVSVADAWDLARRIGAKYIESSSYSKDRIKEVFDTAIWDALLPLQQKQHTSPPLWKRILCLV